LLKESEINALKEKYDGKTIIITGTGSWAKTLAKTLLKNFKCKIVMFSRNELNIVKTKEEFKDYDNVKILIGDIKDKNFLVSLLNQYFEIILFHTSALKHITICEEQVSETINTNIIGTRNLLEAIQETNLFNSEIFLVSTDKACNPINTYGLSKGIAERLFQDYSRHDKNNIYGIIRAGNVLGSNGSVMHIFNEQINTHKSINLTDDKMTRFFLTLQDAINLLLTATLYINSGQILVTKMKSVSIKSLAEVVLQYNKLDTDRINIIGKRPAEKLHEELISQQEKEFTYKLNDDFFIIMPYLQDKYQKSSYQEQIDKLKLTKHNEVYTSENNLISKYEILKMLLESGLI